MATTISSYAFSAPGKDVVGGKEPEEDGSDSFPLPSFVDFVLRLRGVVYKNGKVQEKYKCLSLFTLYFGLVGGMTAGLASCVLLGMPVWLASIYFVAFLSIVGSSRLDFLTVLDSPRWRNMMKNNKYGVLEKMERSAKKYPLYILQALLFSVWPIILLYWLTTQSVFTPQISMALMALTTLVGLLSVLFEMARLITARIIQGALQMNESKYMVRDYFALVRHELLKEEPSLYLLAKEQQEINAFCHDVNRLFRAPSQTFVFIQLVQMIVYGVGAVVKLNNNPVEPIFGELTWRATSLVFAAHAIYFARQNLKVCSVFDSTARQEVKELHNLRYLHGWAKLGIGGSITFYEWLKHGHYIHAEILGIPVTAENVSRFSSALLSGLGVMLATAIRSYMDV